MKVNNPKVKNDLTHRLQRIEGQIRGIQKMIDEERDCHEILQQLAAVRSAFQGASLVFIQEAACDCVLNLEKMDQAARVNLIGEMVDLLGKAS
jgi:DNA-binding FrmR family transcriptional regulator